MLSANSVTTQAVAVDAVISFNNTSTQTGRTSVNNVTSIALNKPGFYKVDFNATVSGDGDVTIGLYNNGVAVNGAVGTVSTTATTSDVIAFTTIIRVPCNCCFNTATPVNLTLRNTGVASNVTNANINVTKIA